MVVQLRLNNFADSTLVIFSRDIIQYMAATRTTRKGCLPMMELFLNPPEERQLHVAIVQRPRQNAIKNSHVLAARAEI